MSVPVFLHVMSDGKLWISNDIGFTPAGTVAGTYRFLDDAKSQLIGTLSGTISSSLVAGSANGKTGKEIT